MEKKCPYCSKPMEIGYIYNGKGDVVWTPENSRPNMIINLIHKDQIMLSKSRFFMSKIKVYRCPECKVQIIYEDEL